MNDGNYLRGFERLPRDHTGLVFSGTEKPGSFSTGTAMVRGSSEWDETKAQRLW